jgi:hypothetical protein
MATETQISAFISAETKEELEKYSRATGVKKGRVIEDALRHHLQALRELPLDAIIHPRIVLTRASGEALVKHLKSRSRPTAALRKLMSEPDGD